MGKPIRAVVRRPHFNHRTEPEKAAQDVGTAGETIGRFVERELKGVGRTLSEADKRIREGKVGDMDHPGITMGASAASSSASPALQDPMHR